MDDEYIAELLEYVGVEGTDDFAKRFDHTNLHPFSGERQIRKLCEEASEWGFATVCVAPRWIVPAMEIFDEIEKKGGRRIPVCTVIGFPHGDNMPGSKISEAREAAGAGATEIDMVLAIGELIAGRDTPVHDDIEGVCKAAHAQGAIVKVIVETAYLLTPRITISADEWASAPDYDRALIEQACRLAVSAGADFVKTSTGFARRDDRWSENVNTGAHPVVVRWMRNAVGPDIGVKAAGGIRSLVDALEMRRAGASRLGCSSSVKILETYRRFV